MSVVYLSGGITGVPDYKNRFDNAEIALKAMGYEKIINPAHLDKVMESFSYEEYMSVCFGLIDIADVVVMLPESEKSAGATREEMYAAAKHKLIVKQWKDKDGNTHTPRIPRDVHVV